MPEYVIEHEKESKTDFFKRKYRALKCFFGFHDPNEEEIFGNTIDSYELTIQECSNCDYELKRDEKYTTEKHEKILDWRLANVESRNTNRITNNSSING